MTATVSARVALDLNELAKTLVENLDGDRLAGFIYNLVGLRSDKLWEAELVAELSEPYEVPTPVAPATEDPAPRVWNKGDAEPADKPIVQDRDGHRWEWRAEGDKPASGFSNQWHCLDDTGHAPWPQLLAMYGPVSALPTPGGAK